MEADERDSSSESDSEEDEASSRMQRATMRRAALQLGTTVQEVQRMLNPLGHRLHQLEFEHRMHRLLEGLNPPGPPLEAPPGSHLVSYLRGFHSLVDMTAALIGLASGRDEIGGAGSDVVGGRDVFLDRIEKAYSNGAGDNQAQLQLVYRRCALLARFRDALSAGKTAVTKHLWTKLLANGNAIVKDDDQLSHCNICSAIGPARKLHRDSFECAPLLLAPPEGTCCACRCPPGECLSASACEEYLSNVKPKDLAASWTEHCRRELWLAALVAKEDSTHLLFIEMSNAYPQVKQGIAAIKQILDVNAARLFWNRLGMLKPPEEQFRVQQLVKEFDFWSTYFSPWKRKIFDICVMHLSARFMKEKSDEVYYACRQCENCLSSSAFHQLELEGKDILDVRCKSCLSSSFHPSKSDTSTTKKQSKKKNNKKQGKKGKKKK